MPQNSSGKHFMNPAVAKAHEPQPDAHKAAETPVHGGHVEVHKNPHGGFHTMHNGKKQDHASLQDVHSHLQGVFGDDGDPGDAMPDAHISF